jgi:hypothetical protein
MTLDSAIFFAHHTKSASNRRKNHVISKFKTSVYQRTYQQSEVAIPGIEHLQITYLTRISTQNTQRNYNSTTKK